MQSMQTNPIESCEARQMQTLFKIVRLDKCKRCLKFLSSNRRKCYAYTFFDKVFLNRQISTLCLKNLSLMYFIIHVNKCLFYDCRDNRVFHYLNRKVLKAILCK